MNPPTFLPVGVNLFKWIVRTSGLFSIKNCFSATTNFLHLSQLISLSVRIPRWRRGREEGTYFSHRYLFCPLSISILTRFSNPSLIDPARFPKSKERSSIASNVSELWVQEVQCTLDLRTPPKSWWIGFWFFCEVVSLLWKVKRRGSVWEGKSVGEKKVRTEIDRVKKRVA